MRSMDWTGTVIRQDHACSHAWDWDGVRVMGVAKPYIEPQESTPFTATKMPMAMRMRTICPPQYEGLGLTGSDMALLMGL